jgi:uncharacterized integral membrane protein
MRLLRAILALLFVVLGIVFGALNRDPVVVDFAFARLPTRLGIALLAALLVGTLLGGLAVRISRGSRRPSAPAEPPAP